MQGSMSQSNGVASRSRSSAGTVERYEYRSVKEEQDHATCRIGGMSPLPDGGLVIAVSGNSCIKRLDQQFNIIDRLNLRFEAFSICSNGAEVAASLGNCKVVIVSLEAPMMIVREIKVRNVYKGLACHNGKLLCRRQTSKGSIMLDRFDWLSCEREKQVALRYDGRKINGESGQLSISDDGGVIYVSNYSRGVLLLDSAWNVVKTVGSPDNLFGVCAGTEGCCYISMCISLAEDGYSDPYEQVVKRYNSDGDFLETIIKHDQLKGKCARLLSYIRHRNILVVAHRDEIGIFYLGNQTTSTSATALS